MKLKSKKKNAGVWLDQSKAVIVLIDGKNIDVKKLKSSLKRHHKATGGSRKALPYVYNGGADGHNEENKRKQELKEYFDKILEAVQDANKLYIFGPSAAKFGLQNQIESSGKIKNATVEVSDNLTDRQIIAHVKKHYHALTGH
ncbi:MAG: hypothetical protein AB7F59_04155 [Bdellovibrionales bacterium]